MASPLNEDIPTNRTFDLIDNVRVLDPATFEAQAATADGLVVRCPEHGEKRKVKAEPCFPVTDWGCFVVFTDEEGEELGVIEDIRALEPSSREAVAHELDNRHFLPVITRVINISREFHMPIWEVETDRGPRTFTCKGRRSAQRMGSGRFYVRDADGNGYLIPDVQELDAVSRRLIETNT